MIKKIYFLFFIFPILFGSAGLLAQDPGIQKKPQQSIEWIGEGYINSTTITNNFIGAFYRGDFIDELLKENASRRIATVNRFGAASKWGMTYTFQAMEGTNRPAFSFSFFDRAHINLKFSDDLFNTVFYGNKRFAGSAASLGNFKYSFLRYQQFRFGWDWKGDQTHGAYGLAFSLLSGDRNNYVNVLFADMFTEQDGKFIDLYLKMNIEQTDTSSKSCFFAQNGTGVSTDFYYKLPYIAWKNPGSITFEVKDMGFIRWKNNSMHHTVDSSFHYEGVQVDDLFNMDSTFATFIIDDAVNKNTLFSRKRYTTNIPFTLDVHTKVFYGKKIAFEKGVAWLFNSSAKPYYYARLHFLFGRKKSVDLACLLGYGGYGGFNAGLDAKIDFAKHYSFHFTDNYLFSGIAARSSYGMGLYMKLVRRF